MRKLFMGCMIFATCLVVPQVHAQSLKDILNRENVEKAVNTLTQKNTASMEGSWTYTGSAIQFESDNVLKNAGGSLAASAITNKLDEQLERLGMKEGEFSFTFQADSSFVTRLGKKELKGTYIYNAENEQAELRFSRLLKLNTSINCTSSELQMLFNVDKLLDLITFISSKSNSSALQGISALTDSYNGMLLGFALKKDE